MSEYMSPSVLPGLKRSSEPILGGDPPSLSADLLLTMIDDGSGRLMGALLRKPAAYDLYLLVLVDAVGYLPTLSMLATESMPRERRQTLYNELHTQAPAVLDVATAVTRLADRVALTR